MLDAHLNTSAAVCHHDKTPRNVEAQAISPLPTHAMHVATRLIHLYLMHPRTICASSLRLYLPGASALPALAVGKSLNHWASEASSHRVSNARCPQAGNLDAAFQ